MATKPETKRKKPARRPLSEKQWRKLRARYENEPGLSVGQLARQQNVPKSTMETRKRREGWQKKDEGAEGVKRVVNLNGVASKYRTEYCGMIVGYFKDAKPYREVEEASGRIRAVPNTFPNLSRFAAEIGVTRATLWNWANERDENGNLVRPNFFDCYHQAVSYQESLLIEGSISGAYNPVIAQLVLKNHHHYMPLVPPPSDSHQDRGKADELDAVYESALKLAAEKQTAIEGRYERLVGHRDAAKQEVGAVDAEYHEI
jgi:hypothetical protein